LAIGITGGFSLIVENILFDAGFIWQSICADYSLFAGRHGLWFDLRDRIIPSDGMSLLAPFPAVLGLGIYTLLFLGIAIWFFQRQDLGSGS